MKLQFNSKMANSPFYVGPSIFVDGGRWSFIRKEKKSYKFIIGLIVVSIVVLLILI